MGAGQIGGIATLLDLDFENAAGFLGEKAMPTEGQYMVYFFSQALMFCVGALIEAHIVLTPAMCVYGEKAKFDVYGGTHSFIENSGVSRTVNHLALHRGYNHTLRYTECITDNLALLVLVNQYNFNKREPGSEFVLNRVRYGITDIMREAETKKKPIMCEFFGWGSRRNGYLIPLLITKRKMVIRKMPKGLCPAIWNKDNKYLCLEQPTCRSEKYGALCPDDVGSILTCSGFARGMMASMLVDRPCGVGFLDLSVYNKFLTCGVDDSRDVISHDEFIEFTTLRSQPTPSLIVPPIILENDTDNENNDTVKENVDEGKTPKGNDTRVF